MPIARRFNCNRCEYQGLTEDGLCTQCKKTPRPYKSRAFGFIRVYDEEYRRPWYIGNCYKDYSRCRDTTVCSFIFINWIIAFIRFMNYQLKYSHVLLKMSDMVASMTRDVNDVQYINDYTYVVRAASPYDALNKQGIPQRGSFTCNGHRAKSFKAMPVRGSSDLFIVTIRFDLYDRLPLPSDTSTKGDKSEVGGPEAEKGGGGK